MQHTLLFTQNLITQTIGTTNTFNQTSMYSLFNQTICICIQLDNMYLVRQYVSVCRQTICICIQLDNMYSVFSYTICTLYSVRKYVLCIRLDNMYLYSVRQYVPVPKKCLVIPNAIKTMNTYTQTKQTMNTSGFAMPY